MRHMEFTLTPESVFWFKVAAWFFIGGCFTWVLSIIWSDDEKKKGWQNALQKEKRKRKDH